MRLVVALDGEGEVAAAQVGGKAAGLARLLAAGFPVPPGLCVTTSAFRLAIDGYRPRIQALLQEQDLGDPAIAAAVAAAIASLLEGVAVPAPVMAALSEALPETAGADTLLAVRSSATAEDKADASFAGQYATVLGVRGE
ncbi:MAG TPA: PEP/pyruvate-binding domain-containing protein, partial [Anaerolineae bacterium]